MCSELLLDCGCRGKRHRELRRLIIMISMYLHRDRHICDVLSREVQPRYRSNSLVLLLNSTELLTVLNVNELLEKRGRFWANFEDDDNTAIDTSQKCKLLSSK